MLFIFLNIHGFGQIRMKMVGFAVSKTSHKECFLRLKEEGICLFPCLSPMVLEITVIYEGHTVRLSTKLEEAPILSVKNDMT